MSGTRLLIAKILFSLICVMFLTFLRQTVYILYIFLPLVFWLICAYRISAKQLLLFLLILLSAGVSSYYYDQMYWQNNTLSLLFFLPVIFVFFFEPVKIHKPEFYAGLLAVFIKTSTIILIINNVIGVIQYFFIPYANQDDAFIGIYSRHAIAGHGLGVINAVFFIYYMMLFQRKRSLRLFALVVFFGFSFFLAYYGLALLSIILAYLIAFTNKLWKPKILLKVAATVALVYFSFSILRPNTLRYNTRIVTKLYEVFEQYDKLPKYMIPGKIKMVNYYFERFPADASLFLFGAGPGNFNSRTAWLLNGDYSSGNVLESIFGIHHPPIASDYLFKIWTKKIGYSQKRAGTINQPFSSFFSVLAEYGFLFALFFWLFLAVQLRKIIRLAKAASAYEADLSHLPEFILISFLFVFIIMLGDSLIEFSEIVFLVIIWKLIELLCLSVLPNSANSIRREEG